MLKKKEVVLLTGESVINGNVVCTFNAQIDSENPSEMIMSNRQNDKVAYKIHRKDCIEDQAEFEDFAYQKQDEMIAKLAKTE